MGHPKEDQIPPPSTGTIFLRVLDMAHFPPRECSRGNRVASGGERRPRHWFPKSPPPPQGIRVDESPFFPSVLPVPRCRRGIARSVVEETRQPLSWSTPLGVPVVQPYAPGVATHLSGPGRISSTKVFGRFLLVNLPLRPSRENFGDRRMAVVVSYSYTSPLSSHGTAIFYGFVATSRYRPKAPVNHLQTLVY